MSTTLRRTPSPNQRGTVLTMALIFLLIMTILAVTAVSTSNLEEKMAGNLKDQHIAFQAAEATLRVAENAIQTATPTFSAACTGGYCLQSTTGVPVWESGTVDWSSMSTTSIEYVYGTGAVKVAAEPRYIIEDTDWGGGGDGGSTGSVVTGTGSPPPPVLQGHFFRITARGVGGTPASQVMLQTIYVK